VVGLCKHRHEHPIFMKWGNLLPRTLLLGLINIYDFGLIVVLLEVLHG
jgi:hypothetical protein